MKKKTLTAQMLFSSVVAGSKAVVKEKAAKVAAKEKEKAATLPMTGMNGMKTTTMNPITKEKVNAALAAVRAKAKAKENSGVPSKDQKVKAKEKVKDSKAKEKVTILLSLPLQP